MPTAEQPTLAPNPTPCPEIPSSSHAMARAVAHRHGYWWLDSGDLAAEAALGMVEASQRYVAQGHLFTSFAWHRMRGRTLDLGRRESRERRYRAELAVTMSRSEQPDAETLAVQIDVHRMLHQAAAVLDTGDRIVLDEVYWQGRPIAEVSRRQGWSRQRTYRNHRRLLSKLRNYVHA